MTASAAPSTPTPATGASVASMSSLDKIHALRVVQAEYTNDLVAAALNHTNLKTPFVAADVELATAVVAGMQVGIEAIQGAQV